jgi:hypothetical protein
MDGIDPNYTAPKLETPHLDHSSSDSAAQTSVANHSAYCFKGA